MGMILGRVGTLTTSSQTTTPLLPPEAGERVVLQCDRSLYGVSETLHYTAACQKPAQIGDLGWSSVLYVELIRWDGTQLAGSKAAIIDGHAIGNLQIPETVLSGNYYLRAYTRWMRNYSPYRYAYLPLKVMNPASPLIDQGPESGAVSDGVRFYKNTRNLESVVLEGLQENYGTRQPVELNFSLSDPGDAGSYSLAVARQRADDIDAGQFWITSPGSEKEATEIQYFPEIDGLSLTGKVVNRATGAAVPGMKVNLSSYSGSFHFASSMSDEEGKFAFVLPSYQGNHEFHVAKENGSEEKYQILIGNEFCRQEVELPYVPFELEENEKALASEIMFNARLGQRYLSPDVSAAGRTNGYQGFYGVAGTVYHSKDYIELDDLEEFFFEVIHEVLVGRIKQVPYLMVTGTSSLVGYPPLILMDNIPVTDIGNLLEAGMYRIDRVEVVNKGYVVGDYRYNGVISIFSASRDMAGIALTGDSRFFSYQLFSESESDFPDYSGSLKDSPVADRRNLLYWEPQLKLTEGAGSGIRFYTSDAPGSYVVLLRRLQPDGSTLFFKTATFTVK